jgi:predicted nucleotidyltransferase
MNSLSRLASDLSVPERTLRRAAHEGLLRGERESPRRFRTTLREQNYLRTHWPLLRVLRAAFRTEPNVELAVLFGSTATGQDQPSSDLDVLVIAKDATLGRLAEMADRLSHRAGREVQLVRLADAETSPILMDDILAHGRVLIDRSNHWSRIRRTAPRWRREARRAERSLSSLPHETLDASTV